MGAPGLLGRILDSLRSGKHREPRKMGPLPELGKWVRLSVPAQKIGLSAKDQVNGIAFTQWDGTTYWDKIGVSSKIDPRKDPHLSLRAWTAQAKEDESLPAKVQNALKKAAKDRSLEDSELLKTHFLQYQYRGIPDDALAFGNEFLSTKTNSRNWKPRSKRPTKISKITVRSLEACWSPKVGNSYGANPSSRKLAG